MSVLRCGSTSITIFHFRFFTLHFSFPRPRRITAVTDVPRNRSTELRQRPQ